MEKRRVWPRWLVFVILYIAFACAYFFAEKALGFYGLEYRTVTVVVGNIILWIIPWTAGIFLIRLFNRRRIERGITSGWSSLTMFLLIFYLIIMIFASGFAGVRGMLRLPTEEKKEGVLLVTVPHFLDASEIYYCDPAGPLLRRPFEWDDKREAALLSKKYRMDFTPDLEEDGVRRYIPENYPDVRVRILDPVPLRDNFAQELAAYYFQSAYEADQMQTAWEIEDSNGYKDGDFTLVITERSGISEAAQDAADLIRAACEDPFYQEYEGWITCVLRLDAQEHSETFYFGAHKPFEEDGTPYDYYADYETVFPVLENAWLELKEDVHQQLLDSALNTDPSQGKEWEAIQKRQEDQYIREYQESEAGALALYESLTGSTEEFEPSYNAKGYLYVLLPAGDTQRSIMYDRVSQNELCNLYALYEYTVDENGNPTSEKQMIDYYAVNITTGEIIPSGKQAYADSGTEAYHEATGEW